MGYTRSEIIEKCKKAIGDVANFYKQDFINYRGKTEDTDEYYTEVIAEFVCENIDDFMKIPMITRKKSYRVETHSGEFAESSNRLEEITAMKMYLQSKADEFDFIGKIIDYQTPLKNEKGDETGKIDLLSTKNNVLYILELKKEDSKETMLRCVLEGFTYMKTVDVKKLLSDFKLPIHMKVKSSPFVFKNGEQHKEMREQRRWLCRLMDLLDSTPYYISVENEKYIVTGD